MIGVDALIISGFVFLTVYRNLKPLFTMAKFELKFMDSENQNMTIKCNIFADKEIEVLIEEEGRYKGCVYLDKSTAIKFAKTLRTEINKIKESENN